jgi:hypothetical protein
MNVLEDKLRAALRETGEEIRPHSVPPLRLDQPGRRPGLPRTPGRSRWGGWLTPLAAAAAVAAVIIASVVIGKAFAGRQSPATSAAPGGLPQYYVALRFSGHSTCCRANQPLLPRTHAVVVDTATGKVLATIAPPNPRDTFVGVTGAADDRTFVLGVQRYGTLSPTRFYLLRILLLSPVPLASIIPTAPARHASSAPPVISTVPAASVSPGPPLSTVPATPANPASSGPQVTSTGPASSATFTPAFMPTGPASPASPDSSATPVISTIPATPAGPADLNSRNILLLPSLSALPIPADTAEIANFALSPRGTSLAVLDLRGVHVFDLATGAARTWDRPPCFAGSLIGGANTGAVLSWAADNRRLAFACNAPWRPVGVWLLDTTAPGNNLLRDSQRLVHGPKIKANGQPPWDGVLLTTDGRMVVGVLEVHDPHRPVADSPQQELAEFSTRTGKLLRVVNRIPVWNFADFEQVLWASPSGHALLVSDAKPYHGKRRAFFLLNDAGVLTGQHFTPLRHWSLNTMAAAW